MPLVVTKAKKPLKPRALTAQEKELARAVRGVFNHLDISPMYEHNTIPDMIDSVEWYNPQDLESQKIWRIPLDRLKAAMKKAVEHAGQQEVRALGFADKVRFTVQKKVTIPVNRKSWQWIGESSSQLVKNISDEQRETLQEILAEGFAQGIRPASLVDEIKKVVGLHDRYARAVVNRKQKMLESGASEEAAERAAARYAEELKASRAKTIARTENKNAMEQGRMDSWRMLRSEGLIEPEAQKEWVSVEGSPRTSDICLDLDDQIVGIDENFYSNVLGREVERPPAHPNCRSTVRIIIPE